MHIHVPHLFHNVAGVHFCRHVWPYHLHRQERTCAQKVLRYFVVHAFDRKLRTNYKPREGEILQKSMFERMKEMFSKGTPRVPPSGANPSNLVGKEIDVEDDVLHIKKLPDFGGYITQYKAELFIQYLTVPYLRIPLVMQFFSSQEHTKALVREELQDILDCCIKDGIGVVRKKLCQAMDTRKQLRGHAITLAQQVYW